ncbi:MAG: glycosyltransferase family 4 protein [Candidatus Lindowbacteria bacterium]|nr:glycosyltransferase family 4 protein [Candidatus Lindowbacteria bacterium]
MDQMQVLVVTSDYPPEVGGMAEYSDAWCRELADQGFDVSVINQTSSPATEGRNPAIPSETVTWPQSPRLFPLYAYQTLKTALELKKPDFVFAHTWIGWAPALSYLKGKMQGLKYVVSAHGAEIIGPAQSTYYRFLMKTGLKGADLILPVSQFTAEHVSQLGISKERIRVVGNGVDIQKYNSTTPSPELLRKYKLENCQILLTVGALVERKGHDVVIRALAKIKDDYPKLRYLICGG